MHRLLRELEAQLPDDCEEKVRRAKDRFNQHIRERLMAELRFNLQVPSGNYYNKIYSEIPIKVVPGYPSSLQGLSELSNENHIADLISIWEMDVINLGRSAERIQELVRRPELETTLQGNRADYDRALDSVLDLSKLLRKQMEEASLAKRVFAIQDDILGLYRPRPNNNGEIYLYWTAIGVVARLLQVDSEDLATVTLIHELSHGYTHLGKDIDGSAWDTDLMFDLANRAVVEGLAQYYTDVISEYLGDNQRASIHEAYLRLRRKQRGWYRVHDGWIPGYSSEVVRIALLKFRRDSKISLDAFQSLLASEKVALKAQPREVHMRVTKDIEAFGPIETLEESLLDSAIIQEHTSQLRFEAISDFLEGMKDRWDVEEEPDATKTMYEAGASYSSISTWSIAHSKEFDKSTDKLDQTMRGRIFKATKDLCTSPTTSRGDTIKRLNGDFEGLWRYRIGDNRLLYRVETDTKRVVLLEFGPRGSIYD